uniref:60S ribosomal protein L37a n=1 Tax=Lactuca sativa TaxID=4236 RepID=A0A9R1WTQ0_LACSA|nr:hypothetical protein LSAT_V11C900472270 [Lactuca sativa]
MATDALPVAYGTSHVAFVHKVNQKSDETKRTKKADIVEKCGTHYGGSLRKQIKKREVSHHSKFIVYVEIICICFEMLKQYAVKRKAVGIWGCKDCGKVKAGGAYILK